MRVCGLQTRSDAEAGAGPDDQGHGAQRTNPLEPPVAVLG